MVRPRLHSPVLWIAILAVLWGVLAPSLTNLLVLSSGKTWVEVCTSTGTKLAAIDVGEPDDQKSSIHTSGHCPYCRLQQDLPAVAHAPGVLVLADGSVRGVPMPPELTPRLLAAVWPAHYSRAPPHFS